MNKYTALPMAMAGALSGDDASKRIFGTATFFTSTVIPGALDRYGAAFKSAAKVRLMHSMVRFHGLHSKKWCVKTYGIPVPQVDQMPAGQNSALLLSLKVIKQGRNEFTDGEQAEIEFFRYRCFLLGLPEELLGETPQEICNLMLTIDATIRDGFDDATCGPLVRSTMSADLSQGDSFVSRIIDRMEFGFTRLFFLHNFCNNDLRKSNDIGVAISVSDRLYGVLATGLIYTQMGIFSVLSKIPGLRNEVDGILLSKLDGLLRSYGEAEFVTDLTIKQTSKSYLSWCYENN